MGSGGGKVTTTDGLVTVDVPAGALPTDTNITITEIPAPIADSVGKTFEIGPTGTQFAVPVTLSFQYGGFDLAGNAPSELEVATIANGAWVALSGQAIDTTAQIASAQTTHLSPYAIHGKGHHDDAGADATTGDDGGTDAGADTGPADAGFDAAGCQFVAQQVGTCINHSTSICPMPKVLKNCTDTVPMGYSGYCCN